MGMKRDRKKTKKNVESVAIMINTCYRSFFKAYCKRLKVLARTNYGLQEVSKR
jgi:hypothetical protein